MKRPSFWRAFEHHMLQKMRHTSFLGGFIPGSCVHDKAAMRNFAALNLFVDDVQPVGERDLLVVGHWRKYKVEPASSHVNNKAAV